MKLTPTVIADTREQHRMSVAFDLRDYAKQHRLRTRNLHDGASVPPAKKIGKGRQVFTGDDDRWDAIVGRRGYVAMDGDRLSVFAYYPSVRSKTAGMRKLVKAGVVIQQEGETEIGGWAPVGRIEDVLAAIRVIRIRRYAPGSAPTPPGRAPWARHATQRPLDGKPAAEPHCVDSSPCTCSGRGSKNELSSPVSA